MLVIIIGINFIFVDFIDVFILMTHKLSKAQGLYVKFVSESPEFTH